MHLFLPSKYTPVLRRFCWLNFGSCSIIFVLFSFLPWMCIMSAGLLNSLGAMPFAMEHFIWFITNTEHTQAHSTYTMPLYHEVLVLGLCEQETQISFFFFRVLHHLPLSVKGVPCRQFLVTRDDVAEPSVSEHLRLLCTQDQNSSVVNCHQYRSWNQVLIAMDSLKCFWSTCQPCYCH